MLAYLAGNKADFQKYNLSNTNTKNVKARHIIKVVFILVNSYKKHISRSTAYFLPKQLVWEGRLVINS